MGKNSKRQELLSQDSIRVLQFSVQSLQKAALHPYCLDKLKTCAPTRISPQLGEELCRFVKCSLHPASNFAHMRSTTALDMERATQQHTKTVPTRSTNSSFAHNMHSNLLSHCCNMSGESNRNTGETWLLQLRLIWQQFYSSVQVSEACSRVRNLCLLCGTAADDPPPGSRQLGRSQLHFPPLSLSVALYT